jgi:hypothetical protein
VSARAKIVGAALALGVGLAQGGGARAACGGSLAAATGPLPAGVDAADYGAIPEACAGTDASLRLRGTALVASDMPDYYGAVTAATTLRLRLRVGRTGRTWLSFAADVFTFRYVVNAVVASDGFSVGPPTLGVHRALADGELFAATIYARALLPLDSARASGLRMGLELGTALRRALGTSGRWGIEGGAALVSPLVVIKGQGHATLEPVALAQGWFSPSPGAALFAGASTRAGLAPDAAFLALAPRAGLRISSSRGPWFAFLAELPVAGDDRTDAILAIFLGWTPPPPARAAGEGG